MAPHQMQATLLKGLLFLHLGQVWVSLIWIFFSHSIFNAFNFSPIWQGVTEGSYYCFLAAALDIDRAFAPRKSQFYALQ